MSSSTSEVYSWGGDHFGQLGLSSKSPGKTYNVPRYCTFSLCIRAVSCGEDHAAFLTEKGEVYTMGSNTEGRLGVGNRTLRGSSNPIRVETLLGCRVAGLSCGWTHTAVLTDTGDVYSWGSGDHGALGTGACESQWLPVLIRISRDFTPLTVSCGARHSVVIGESRAGNREVWSCGSGEAGQLGTGRREKEVNFVRIVTPESIKQASCGVFHTGMVGASGRVYTMGGNSFGQLGLGHKKSCSTPQRLTSLDPYSITKVSCGNHSAAVSDRGQLFLWGSGAFGEFLTPQIVGEMQARVTDVEVGGTFGAVLDGAGNVWTWGNNTNGELGLGDYDSRSSPTLLPSLQGKSIRLLACGASFCLALGQDSYSLSSPSPLRRESNRSVSRAAERPPSRSSHVRSITSIGFEPSKSPIRGRDDVRTPDVSLDRDALRGYYNDVRGEVSRLRESMGAGEDRKMRDMEGRVEEMQRRVTAESGKVKRLEECMEAERMRREEEATRAERELQACKADVDSLNSYIDQMHIEKQDLSDKLAITEESNIDLQASLEQANSSLLEMQTALRAKDKETALLKNSYEDAIREREKFEDLAEENCRKMGLFEEKARNNDSEKSLLEKEIDDLRDSFRREKQRFDDISANSKREIDDLRYHLDCLEGEKQSIEGDLTSANSEIDQYSKALKAAKDQTKDLIATNQALISDLDVLRTAMTEKDTEIATLKRDVEITVRERKTDLSNMNQLQLLILDREGECEDATREKDALEEEIGQLTENLRKGIEENEGREKENSLLKRANEGLKETIEDLTRQLQAEKSDFEDIKARWKRMEDGLCQAKERFQTELQRKDEEKTRLTDTYERKLSTYIRELSDLKSSKSKLEADFLTELTKYKKIEEDLRIENDRKTEELRRYDQSHAEAIDAFQGEIASLTERLLCEESQKRVLDQDLDSALSTIQRLEDSLRSQQQTAESDIKALESSMRVIENRFQQQIDTLTRALTEEKDKRQSADKESAKESGERRRLEDAISTQNRKLEGLNKEIDRLRSALTEKDGEIRTLHESAKSVERKLSIDFDSVQSEALRLNERLNQCQIDLQTRENDLKSASDKVEALVESEHQLQMAVDRLNDEKGRLQKQVYDSVSAVERQKRAVEDLVEKNNTVTRKLDEVKGYNLELEGKHRDLYLRLEKDMNSRARDKGLLPPSPIRIPYTDLGPPSMLKAQSPERRPDPDLIPRLGLTPDRPPTAGRWPLIETTPIRTQNKAYTGYASPMLGSGEAAADARGRFSSYKDKKVEFETHLMDLQRRIEEGGKVA